MKSIGELTDFYYNTLFPTLETLERQRQALASKAVKIFIAIAVAALAGIYIRWYYFGAFDILSSMFLIAGAIIAAWVYQHIIQDYRSDFKMHIMKPLIEEIDEGLRYAPLSKISQTLFERSRLFQGRIERFKGNDLVQGTIESVNLQFSDLHVESLNKDAKGNSHTSTIFQGLYIVAEFNKHFKSQTIILPDSAQKVFGNLLGNWFQSQSLGRDNLITLDNAAFEKAFVVYGNDPIESRYILTHSMMERLLNFRQKVDHPVSISFVDANIHIAIAYNKDLFEPSVFQSLLKYENAMSYIHALSLAVGIVQELKLNERLWSK